MYKLPITTIERETELGVIFSNISDISYCLLFANSQHEIVYGGDYIGYTYLKFKKEMPLNVKKIFLVFNTYIYDHRKEIRKSLEEKYGDINNLTKDNKVESLKNFTTITLSSNELCDMLNKKVNKDNKKTIMKMVAEFVDYFKNNVSGICKTHYTTSYCEPMFYGCDREERSKYIKFYFVDFFILQTILSKRPMYITKGMYNARSNRTYSLALVLATVKYNNIINVQNGTYNSITIRSVFEVCNISDEEYKNMTLKNLKNTVKRLFESALKLIDKDATFKMSNERSVEQFIKYGKVTFKIPIFDERVSFLKEYINKHQEKIESSIYRQTLKLQEEIIELNTAKYVSEEEKEKIKEQRINMTSKEFDKNKCK